MPIYVGSTQANAFYLGSTIILPYLGSTLVGAAPGVYLPTVAIAPQVVAGARKMVSDYSGALGTVARLSDSATQDVPAGSDDRINMAPMTAWAAGSEMKWTQLNDQSGAGNNPVQATAANRAGLRAENAWRGLQGITIDGFPNASGATTVRKGFTLPTTVTTNQRASTVYAVFAAHTSYAPNSPYEQGANGVGKALYFQNVASNGAQILIQGSGAGGNGSTKFMRGNPSIIGHRLGATISRIITDNESQQLAALAAAASGTGGLLGGTAVGLQFSGRGELFAYVSYPGELSDADDAAVRASLAAMFPEVNKTQTAMLVIEGDSISEGTSSTNLMSAWRQLLPQISQDALVFPMAVHGTTAAVEYPRRAAKMAGIAQTGISKKIAIMGLGSNDLNANTTAATLWGSYVQPYIAYMKGLGYDVIVGTVIPRLAFTTAQEAERISYNQLVRDNAASGGYIVADYCALPEFDAQADASNTTYYHTDNIHLNNAGYAKIATVQAPLVNARLAA